MMLASSGLAGGSLETVMGRLGGLLGRLEAILGRLGVILGRLGSLLDWASRSVLQVILGILDASESAREVSGRPHRLGKTGRCMQLDASRGGVPLEDYRNPVRQHLAF